MSTMTFKVKEINWSAILISALTETASTNKIVQIPIATDDGEDLLNLALDKLIEEGDDRAYQIEVVRRSIFCFLNAKITQFSLWEIIFTERSLQLQV